MLERSKYREVCNLLDEFPSVAILGPRQVGKTTLAQQIAKDRSAIYLDLELEEDLVKLHDAASYFRDHQGKLIILDEVHRAPKVFQTLRSIIDENRRAGFDVGQFLILGSASIDLLRQSGETLAGRIAYLELPSLLLSEVGNENVDQLWVRGGFPTSFNQKSEAASLRQRDNLITTYLQREVLEFSPRISTPTLRKFWTMLAHAQGGLWNASVFGKSLGQSYHTVNRYKDLLEDMFLIRQLEPHHANVKKRLTKSPKIFIRDSGLLHALLKISDKESLLSHPVVGASWESFVIENIISNISQSVDVGFYRTAGGAEIDLVLKQGSICMGIEIKRSSAPTVSKGFYSSCQDLEVTHKYVVHTGSENFSLGDGIKAVTLDEMINIVDENFGFKP